MPSCRAGLDDPGLRADIVERILRGGIALGQFDNRWAGRVAVVLTWRARGHFYTLVITLMIVRAVKLVKRLRR